MRKAWTLTALMVATIALAAGAWSLPAQAASPSFNCAKADSRAEELICGDRELALMDVEATRLFRLVRDGANRPEDEKKALNQDRERWQKIRDECWISSEDLRGCIIASYAVRIHSLRENHAEARMNDDKGITKGPVDLQCKDFKKSLRATFIRSNPPVSTVQFPDSMHVGIGSGARYFERGVDGEMAFWTHGKDAFITMPDGKKYSCVLGSP